MTLDDTFYWIWKIEDGDVIRFAMCKKSHSPSIDASAPGCSRYARSDTRRKNRDTWEPLIRILDPHRFSLNGRPAIDVFNRGHVASRETHISGGFCKTACNSLGPAQRPGVKAFVARIIASISHRFAPPWNPANSHASIISSNPVPRRNVDTLRLISVSRRKRISMSLERGKKVTTFL